MIPTWRQVDAAVTAWLCVVAFILGVLWMLE